MLRKLGSRSGFVGSAIFWLAGSGSGSIVFCADPKHFTKWWLIIYYLPCVASDVWKICLRSVNSYFDPRVQILYQLDPPTEPQFSYTINQSINKINPSIHQSINPSFPQFRNPSVLQCINALIHYSINEWINQSITQLINNQSINQINANSGLKFSLFRLDLKWPKPYYF